MKTYFRVLDACRLQSLLGVSVLAGEKHLNNVINHINVMEVPDVENWVQEEEFLMTTGYMFRDDAMKFTELIPKLKAKKIAALGIKPKRFFDEIPSAVIACAEENELPLLLLPEQTAFSLVIRECMEKILFSEREKRSTFLKHLILGEYKTLDMIFENAKAINLSLPPEYFYTLFTVVEHDDHVTYEKEAIYQKLKPCFLHQGYGCHHVIHQNHIVILILCPPDKPLSFSPALADSLKQVAEEHRLSLCCHSQNQSLLELPNEYTRVMKMARALEYSQLETPIIVFDELGIYSILPELSGSPFHYYCRNKYLLPLKKHDEAHNSQLLPTLKTYIQCNCNMKNTATALFAHYNTICYRIEQIQEILGVDLHDINQICTLYIAFLFKE